MGFAVVLGLEMSVGLFFLLPMVIGGLFDRWITSNLGINLLEGVIRMGIFFLYMYLISRMKDMRRLFSYHGAEHKTIRCYEAKLPPDGGKRAPPAPGCTPDAAPASCWW